jgi:hypothetical protein
MKQLLTAVACSFITLSCVSHAAAETALRTIANPSGGKIVYGPVSGASNEAAAMGSVLRSVHTQCGDRPQVGRVFQVRGTSSVAAFYSVAKCTTQKNAPVAGLVLAAQTGPGHVEAAAVTDTASRFGTTINPMLKKLFSVWHPAGPQPRAISRSSSSSSVPPLAKVTTRDGSASVSLPAGWTMNPVSRYGTIVVSGPHGERALLGSALGAMNANDPRVQRTEAFAQGAGRNTSYAHVLYYPYGADLSTTFVAVLQRSRANLGSGPASIAVTNAAALSAPRPSRCARLLGHVNPGDGAREFTAIFCSGAVSPMGQFMNLMSYVTIPNAYAGREQATADAILGSFSVNQGVVQSQANQMAAPEIARINAIGRMAAQKAANVHAAEDRETAAYESHSAAEDRSSEAFSNYLLDQTVIQDNQGNSHATVWNSTADAMVSGDPSRYQYVATPNYWRGVDY